MPKQEGMPEPEKNGGMSQEEVEAAKARMDNLEYIDGKFVKKGTESHKEAKTEEAKAKQRDEIINGLIKHQIKENPNSFVDQEQARKYWGRFYDNASQGVKLDMQIDEIYAKRYEEAIKDTKNEILILEEKLKLAESKEEKRDITLDIEKLNEDINNWEKEVHARRGYKKPKKEKE